MRTIRPVLSGGSSGPTVTGYAIVDSASPGTNFNGVSAPLYTDNGISERRLWIACTGFSTPFLGGTILPTFTLDSVAATVDGGGAAFGLLKIGTVITSFDVTTITWGNQPDITDLAKVVTGFASWQRVLQVSISGGSGTVTSTTCYPEIPIGNATTSLVTGFVLAFSSTVNGKVSVPSITSIGFKQCALL